MTTSASLAANIFGDRRLVWDLGGGIFSSRPLRAFRPSRPSRADRTQRALRAGAGCQKDEYCD
ncbi:MAG TPA: hypothetical protein VF498_03400 [Anaerolineales bacterium]